MEGESEGLFPSLLRRLFGARDDLPIERTIRDAREDGDLAPEQAAILLNVLRLSRKQVMDIMVPRTDIVCADVGESLTEIARLFVEEGHSRVPIYRENRDNIVGIIHAKDLLRALHSEDNAAATAADIMRPALFIPETKNVYDMLQEFKEKRIHLAIALDEYGGTSGLVTLEDVLEEIVGEIEDEYDEEEPADIQVLDKDTALVSGRATLEDLADEVGILLHSEQVDTVSGYLCELAGRVPDQGERFDLGGSTFLVKEADARQVHWVVVSPLPSPNGTHA
ncbi:MAG: hemolysin family protein [Thermodesulfobacteriota bacterium]